MNMIFRDHRTAFGHLERDCRDTAGGTSGVGEDQDRVVAQKPEERSISKRENREPRVAVYVRESVSVILGVLTFTDKEHSSAGRFTVSLVLSGQLQSRVRLCS